MPSSPFSQVKTDIIPLVGGLDLVTTPVLVPPGRLISSNNFEPDIYGGYKRMPGIERYDGRSRPSDANYYIAVVSLSGIVGIGDTITGLTSGATAQVISVTSNLEIIVTKYTTGTPFVSESIQVSGVTVGTISSISVNSASTNVLHSEYKNLAADVYRADIGVVPGSGYVRGVKYYQGVRYAWRDNAAGTACIMYQATASGWSAITFGKEIQFTGAVGQISDGDTVIQLVSGATGVVKRALLRSGTWTVSGVGTLVFDTITGTFDATHAIQVGGVTKVTASSLATDITLLPGGKFSFDIVNFAGSANTERLYCADGVNLAGEWDGTRWVPIRTGSTPDTPKFVSGFKNQLILATNSDLFCSSIGSPYTYTAITGASDIAVGETITGIKPQTGDANNGAMVVTTNNRVFILYGNSSADFKLVTHSPNSGGRAYTLQNIGFAHFFDARGITQLMTVQAFGGFQMNVLTQAIQPLINAKQGLEISSCIVRSQNQYRVFFSDGTGIIMQVVQNQYGNSTVSGAAMPFDYGDIVFNTIDSVVDSTGIERIYGAATNGYVYELNVGTSLDGENISSHMMMVFNNSKSPRLRKRYRRSILHFRSGSAATVRVGYDLSYGRADASYGSSVERTVLGAGGFWDSFQWDNFTWDSSFIQEVPVNCVGTGENLSLIITNETDKDEAFTVHTCFLHYTQGRLNR